MIIKDIDLQNYLFDIDVNDLPEERRKMITENLREEMIEIYSGTNVF